MLYQIFDTLILEGISKILAETRNNLTPSEIANPILNSGLKDIDATNTKSKRSN